MPTTQFMISIVTASIIFTFLVLIVFSFFKIRKLNKQIKTQKNERDVLFNDLHHHQSRIFDFKRELKETQKSLEVSAIDSFYVLISGHYYIKNMTPENPLDEENGHLTSKLQKAFTFKTKEAADKAAIKYGGTPLGILYLEKKELTEEELDLLEN